MFRLITVICIFVSLGFSQQSDVIKQSNQTEGAKIIHEARQAIGLDESSEISSYFNKFKKTLLLQNGNMESFEEISLILPGKIQAVYGRNSPFFSQSTRTWNGEKYKSTYESESSSGQRIIRDFTAMEKKPLPLAVGNVISKETATALERSRKSDKKNILKKSLWTSLFPLIFSHPFEKNIEFKYVGKAKSDGKTASVVEVKPIGGKTYRLFFDTETNYLLLMITSEKLKNGRLVRDFETKYYFSERELIDGVLIPKKIKIEKKITFKGKAPIVQFFIIEILDFKLNPTLDEKGFDIK